MKGLVVTIGGKPMGGKSGKYSEEESETPDTPGAAATEAFCRAKDAGDYAGAFEAFKEMMSIAEDELDLDEGDEDEMPNMGMGDLMKGA